MGHALHGPQRQLTGPGRGALHAVVPAVGPGLLLHDAKVRAHRAHLRQHPRPAPVVHGVRVPGVIQFKGEAGIAVVGHHVQALVLKAVVVQVGKQAVGGDVHPRRHMLPENICLDAAEADGAFRHKAAVIQQQVGVHPGGGGGTGHIDLRPVGVGLIPEHGAPGVVEGIKGAVLLPEKFTEGCGISLGIEIAGFAVDLVVDLPAYDGRMMPVVPGQLLHNAGAELLINRRVVVVVPAAAVAVKHAVHAAVEHLGILFRQPGGGRGGGGAEDHLHAHPGAQIQETVKKVEGELAFMEFKLAPGKLPYPDHRNPAVQHAAQVILPEGFGPVLGVVTGAYGQGGPLIVLFHVVLLCHVGLMVHAASRPPRV